MGDIDDFAAGLLEEAKRFLERAVDAKGGLAEEPNLHASLMLAFCSLEAHINSVADEMALRSNLDAHDLSVLREREIRLSDGRFIIESRPKFYNLEERICFLHMRFSTKPNLQGTWRAHLSGATTLRNQLTHPKGVPAITVKAVSQAIEAIIEAIDSLYQAVYNMPFPAVGRGLASRLDF